MATETDTTAEMSHRQIKHKQRVGVGACVLSLFGGFTGTYLLVNGLFFNSVLALVVGVVVLCGTGICFAFGASLVKRMREQESAMIDSLAASD